MELVRALNLKATSSPSIFPTTSAAYPVPPARGTGRGAGLPGGKPSSRAPNQLLILKTAGITLSYYVKYKNLFPGSDEGSKDRLERIIGILLSGFVNYDQQIRQIAFSVIGKEIFGSEYLDLEQKGYIFKLIAKVLTLLPGTWDSELILFTNAYALSTIYKFLSDYTFHHGSICLEHPERVAFFPYLRPFSLGHKEIAKEIRRLGFEVFLALDEFSWSKRTQPSLTRRNIINMSVADQPGIFLYPGDIPINIANPEDLRV